MKAQLTYLLHKLRESFWFLPALMTIAAGALSLFTLTLDHNPDLTLIRMLPWSEGLGFANARLILSTVAGSIITAASLVFSLTLVALTLAAGQMGPRLLTLFMRDRMTQFVLGTFVATFVFALLVLASLGDQADGATVPKISIFVSLLLTLLSFGLLIAFIHHLATSLHADEVVARMAQELDTQIVKLFAKKENDSGTNTESEPSWESSTSIASPKRGYVQTIDQSALVKIARCHDTEIQLRFRPGQFVCRDETFARVRGNPDSLEEIRTNICQSIVFGPKRTNAEDPEFALQAIVEIGLRALSPGLNDHYTAVSCLDWLGDALMVILKGSMPDAVYRDEADQVRLYMVPVTLEGLFNTALNELRQTAEGNVAVLIRMAETLERLAHVASTSEQKMIIRRHVDMLARTCKRSIEEELDLKDVDERLRDIEAVLAE